MKSFGTTLAIVGAASAAAILPREYSGSHCCFDIEVTGGSVNGPLGQFTDGQNRVGSGYSAVRYCYYNGTTSIVDSSDRGCVVSPPTSQYQCDAGVTSATAATGITIANNGSIEHNGSAVWYECNSGQGYNIYANSPGSAAVMCSPITLNIQNGNCSAAAAPVSSASPTPYSSTKAATSSTAAASSTPSAYSSPASSSKPSVYSTASSSSTLTTIIKTATTTVQTTTSPSTVAPVTTHSSVSVSSPSVYSSAASASVSSPSVASSAASASASSASVCVPGTIIYSAPTVTVTVTGSSTTVHETSTASASVSVATTTVQTTSASAVKSSTPVSAQSSATTTKASASAASATSSSCPAGLGNSYEYPHLIVPVNSASPNTAYGTQYFGTINSTVSTIFNFDIPASAVGKTCTLEFLLPLQKDLTTSSYTGAGGMIKFEELASVATQATTYANQPAVAKDLGTFDITPGSSTIIASGPCVAGTYSYEAVSESGAALNYFQDYNPSAIGLYVVEC